MIAHKQYGEKELLQRVCRRDSLAMQNLYESHVGYLSALCSRYVTDREAVRDILQESFIRIFTSVTQFEYRGEGSVRAWMTRITVNECLKYIREQGRFGFLQFEENLPDVEADSPDPEVEDVPPQVLQEMIRNLPEGYRTVFNLYVLEEKSHKEIASLLNISENTSASQYHRAKKILAQQIIAYKTHKQYKV